MLASPAAAQNVYHTALGVSAHPASWEQLSFTADVASASDTVAMFDSVDVATVPADAPAVAGYTAGRWPTYGSLVAKFPKAAHISIAIGARYHADCLDVEPGDAVPSEVPAWVRADIAAGFHKPCVYSSTSEFASQIRPLLAAAGISRSQVWEWAAHYTYVPHIEPGFDATQWTDRALGRNLDESMVTRAFYSYFAPNAVPTRVHCYGPQARVKLAKCQKVRAEVRKWSKARDATVRALNSNGCSTVTLKDQSVVATLRQTPVCKTLSQRAEWFQRRIHANLY